MSQVKEIEHHSREYYDAKKRDYFSRLEAIVGQAGYSLQDIIEHFPAFVQRRQLPRLLAHYELFKLIENMPGSIVELGVYRGSGLFTWANLLETFCPGDRTRKVYGFDHFQGLTEHNKVQDGDLSPWLDKVVGNLEGQADCMQALVDLHNDDNFISGDQRVHLIDGDMCQTLPAFVKQHPGLRLSCLYFDVGLYEPTLAGLEQLYPLVMTGGLVVFNGYGMQPWEGEAKAIETYFQQLGVSVPKMQKFAHSPLPHGYFIKN
jgi:hypothetical protein